MHRFFTNHVLANLVFVLVLVLGTLAYLTLPREQDPTINFNWIDITTIYPGASAEDVEKRVTDVLEDAVRKLSDVRFVSSTSRESSSNIVVRFEEIEPTQFDKRVNDLRREIQNKQSEMPDDVLDPVIFEVTSANAFPTATVVIRAQDYGEHLRREAQRVKKELERMKGVDRVLYTALADPEILVSLLPERLQSIGLSPVDVANTIRLYFRDLAAGSFNIDEQNWSIRLIGTSSDPGDLARLPLRSGNNDLRLGDIALIERNQDEARRMVSYAGQPAVMLAITKKQDANIIKLVDSIKAYVERTNQFVGQSGIQLDLVDDQTQITKDALRVMQNNAALGLGLVLFVTWLFVGLKISFLTCIGIPFILAGTFWVLSALGQTLNVSVLLGVVISLGMLVDDAVVVVESIYYRLQRGMSAMTATMESLKEVVTPVTTAVLTTMAAFLPLMLLPGILGQFMLVIPLVVTIALAISLVEAFWILPVHVSSMNINFNNPGIVQRARSRSLHWLRTRYTRLLISTFRRPIIWMIFILAIVAAAGATIASGKIRVDFFASDPIRLFYVNVTMPSGTPLQKTMATTERVEQVVQGRLKNQEVRSVVTYAGQMFTEIEPLFGSHYGQILVSLKPKKGDMRSVDEIISALREDVESIPGPERLAFLRLAGGPPTSKSINIKVRGDDFDDIRRAVRELKLFLESRTEVSDIEDDETAGQLEYRLQIDYDGVRRSGVDPSSLARTLRILVDGEVLTSIQDKGEKVEVRLKALTPPNKDIKDFLNFTLPGTNGSDIPLNALLSEQVARGAGSIRHYNFQRTITLLADIDKQQTDTVTINNDIQSYWTTIESKHPGISLDFTGVLDDIEESLNSIGQLFLFGLGLIYVILGTQFRSYFQPVMILFSIPLAFTGVTLGLYISETPLSLFTLYGVVALAGIAVNSAIVLIAAANVRLEAGYSVAHAIIYAGRRRVIPVMITSLTTIAGLFSLATGLGGKSLLWGPVATSIVWGLTISSVLTLFAIPLLYRLFMPRSYRVDMPIALDNSA